MKSVLIFGINRFAELLCEYMVDDGMQVDAFVIDEQYKSEQTSFIGKPIVYTENLKKDYPVDKYNIIVAMGYGKMNSIREKKHAELKAMGYEIIGYKHPTALVMADSIGEGNVFFENVTIGKHTTIGNGNVFYPCAHIAHHTKVGNYNFFAISCSIAGSIDIGNNCFMGNNCTIKNGIKVHDYTLIGAGCYLGGSTKKCGEVYVPARSIVLDGKNSIDML